MIARPASGRSTKLLVDRAAALFGGRRRSRAAPYVAIELARAQLAATVPGPGTEADRLAAIELAADALGALWLERDWTRARVDDVLTRLAELVGAPAEAVRTAVAARLLADPRLLELPPRIALEVQLGRLEALAPLRYTSLWTLDDAGRIGCAAHAGHGARPSRAARAAAARALAPAGRGTRREVDADRGVVVAVVRRWEQPHAALVGLPAAGGRELARLLLERAARPLGPVLERASLLERNRARERALAGGLERRLTRVGLDLHDGPIQDVAALARDLQLFRSQLAEPLARHPQRPILFGRVDDLSAQLEALDGNLRALTRSLEGLAVQGRPLREALQAETAGFTAESGIPCALECRGSLELLTTSQQIAVVQIVRESLANVREHSGAGRVRVSLARRSTHLGLEIVDDGRGFEVEPALVRAARRGHMGLIGVSERARLLGGTCRIDSRPGGPTTVAVVLPAWQPDAGDEPGPASAEPDLTG